MLGHIKGPAYAPVAACSSFGVALGLAMRAIKAGDAKAAVVGMCDPPPHPLSVATFYRARVLSGDRRPSAPLSDLRGTHVAGGSIVWIVGDHEFFTAQGYKPLGLEILSVGVTSDAHHIITPTRHGPREAIELALAKLSSSPSPVPRPRYPTATASAPGTCTPPQRPAITSRSKLSNRSSLRTCR